MTKDNMETNPRFKKAVFVNHYMSEEAVSYTHLTLPTICSV